MVVAQTLEEFPGMKLISLPHGLSSMGANGFSSEQIQSALRVMERENLKSEFVNRVLSWKHRGLSDENNTKVRRFDPDGPDDTIGFFVAKFQKKL